MSLLVGPAPAGLLIASVGLAAAFIVDAASFVFATATLWLMKRSVVESEHQKETRRRGGNIFADIAAGMRYSWSDPFIRALLVMFAAINFSFVGPFIVGLTWLAQHRFSGAAAFGTILSAWGGSALLGTVIAGMIQAPRRRGILLVVMNVILGCGIASLAFVPNVLSASAIVAAMGFGSGLINVFLMAWLQANTDPAMLGRVMSLGMFSSLGLSPVSYALAGALVDGHSILLFIGAGAIVICASLTAAANRAVREFD
jgi:hypothetical protein